MRVRCGVDVVHVPRLARLLASGGEAFRAAAWLPAELASCGGRPDRLAARWAAKEATLKALGVGIGSVPLTAVEVVGGGDVAPELRLHGEARRLAAEQRWLDCSVSLSHDGDVAVAQVVALLDD